MWHKLSAITAPLVLASLAGTVVADPKPAPPAKPRPSVLAPRAEPFRPGHRKPAAFWPSMTRMPASHLVCAFCLSAPGEQLYTDVSGRVIGRGSPTARGGIVWLNGKPYRPAPSPIFSLDLSKLKH